MIEAYAIKTGNSYNVLEGMSLEEAQIMAKYAGEGATVVQVELKEVKPQRTITQNKALHRYFKELSKLLNDSGFEFREFIEIVRANGITVPWDEHKTKYAWHLIQKPMFGEVSTSELKTDQVSQVYEVMNMKFAEMAGCSMPFPNRFDQMQEAMNNGY